ncbi:MAG: PspC domain-containing protein, partial [Candidatus Thorarchaeota archaeon]
MTTSNALHRSTDDRVLAGVCGGIGKHLKIDPTIVRILWVLFSLFYFTGLIVYIILVLVIPEGPQTASDMHQDEVGASRVAFEDNKTGSGVPPGDDEIRVSEETFICP